MGLFTKTPPHAPRTLRVLARLLSYPSAELREHLPQLDLALRREGALKADRLAELDALMRHLGRPDALAVEEEYVRLFDSGRRTALHLFEHVHGDSRERGPALIDLAQTYEKAGLYLAEGEMPDHLPVVLEFASTQGPREAAGFLGEIAHLINALFNALQHKHSRYAAVMGALLDLAGVPASAVKLAEESPLDDSWEEPQAFGGCSVQGQATPAQQPIHVVRRSRDTQPEAQP